MLAGSSVPHEAPGRWEPEEDAHTLLSRLCNPARTGVPFIDAELPGGCRPGDVLEFFGPAGCAKSEVLLNAATTCVLPERLGGADLRGMGASAVWLDTDGRFSLVRFASLLEQRVRRAFREQRLPCQEADIESCLLESLGRLLFVRCTESSQLRAALCVLLHDRPAGLKMIFLDSANAFFWSDRHSEGPLGSSVRLSSLLAELLGRFGLVCFATKAQLRDGSQQPAVADDHHLGESWRRLVRHHFTLAREDDAYCARCPSGKRYRFRVGPSGIS
jgi:hypothetical protein